MFFRMLLFSLMTLPSLMAQVPKVLVRVSVEVKDDLAYAPKDDRVSEGEIEDLVLAKLSKKGIPSVGYLDLDPKEVQAQIKEKKLGLTLKVHVWEHNLRWESVGKNYDVDLFTDLRLVRDQKVIWKETFAVSGSRNAWPNSISKAMREFKAAFRVPDFESILGIRVLGEVTRLGASLVTCSGSIPKGTKVSIYYPGEELVHPGTSQKMVAPSLLVAKGVVVFSETHSEIQILESYLPVQVGNLVREFR